MNFSNFANQFNQNSGILQLMNDLGQALNPDEEIYMLGGGNPASIPEMENCFRDEMKNLLDDGNQFESMVGNYDAPKGNFRFISALASLLSSTFGWEITDKNIAITNGSQASFGILFNLFAGNYADGSWKNILLPMTPEYIGYSDVGLGERNIFQSYKPVITFDDNDDLYFKYRVDFDNIEIKDNCGAMCVSRPTNPTGNVITDNELKKLSSIAKQARIPLILDGAYGQPFPGIIFSEAQPIWDEHIILCLSLSKLGLPGVRTGIVIADPEVIEIMSGSNAIFNLAPGSFGPSLLTALVESKALIPICDRVITPYYKNRVHRAVEFVRHYMADLPVKVHRPEGALFLWLWFDGLPITSETLYQILKKRGVYVIAGEHFFPGLDDNWDHKHQCIRVSYATKESKLEQGLKIIAEEIRNAYDETRTNETVNSR